MTSRRIQKSK